MLELRKQHIFPSPLVTELVAASTFYPAEDYHQHYYVNHPSQGYCQFVVAPKLAKFKEHFAAKMR
jgi:peptide-methionine (S)-S-oxide reductase